MAKAPNGKIFFHYLVPPFYFRQRTMLKAFLMNQLRNEGKEVEAINYIFCSDPHLLDINQKHLGHHDYTDIITFELSKPGLPLLSDIFISVDRVKENAGLFGVPFNRELLRVIFHGALHLAGYGDKTTKQAEQIRRKEDEWMDAYLVSRGTVSRRSQFRQ